jgi:hypothetical protein
LIKAIGTAGSPVLYMDAPEFAEFVAQDARTMKTVVDRIGSSSVPIDQCPKQFAVCPLTALGRPVQVLHAEEFGCNRHGYDGRRLAVDAFDADRASHPRQCFRRDATGRQPGFKPAPLG